MDVVEFARDPQTALHGRFTWDDTKAAQEYRLEEARRLIRLVVVIHPYDHKPIRAWASLSPQRRIAGGGYRFISDVCRAPGEMDRLVADALDEANRFRAKYRRLVQLVPMMDALIAELEGMRRKKAV